MKKIIFYTIGILAILLFLSGIFAVRMINKFLYKTDPSQMTFTVDTTAIEFDWAKQDFGNFVEPYSAMIIPAKIEGMPHKFYFQFDTGAPTTMIYGKQLNVIQSQNKNLETIEKNGSLYLKNLTVNLGNTAMSAEMIKIYENYGREFDITDTVSRFKIGTIGADIFVAKTGLIDFKNEYLKIYQSRTVQMSRLPDFEPFSFKGRRFIFPSKIDGKKSKLMWDSGCSAFGLITSKHRFNRYTEKVTEELKFDVNSWGNQIPIRHKPSEKSLTIGGTDLELKRVSYVDMYTPIQRFLAPLSNVGGMLGNRPLTDCTLIFDCKKEEFVVLPEDWQNSKP